MPIKINLLAEAQAAEEQRRKDPVKRAVLLAGFAVFLVVLWAVTLQFKIITSSSELSSLAAQWKSLESSYDQVVKRQREAIETEQRLAALDQLRTNRFLWANALNAFQQTLNSLDGIQVTRLKTEQSYTTVEQAAPGAQAAAAKKLSCKESIAVTLEGLDNSNPAGGEVNRFKESIASTAYFRDTLAPTNAVLLTSLSAPQTSEMDGRQFVKFTLQCAFPDKIRY